MGVNVRERPLLSGKKQIHQMLWLELLALSVISMFLLMFHPISVAGSFFIGGLTCLVPNLYQATSFFKEPFARAAVRTVTRLYFAELLKFVVIAAVFIVLMHWQGLNVLAFVIGFLLIEIGVWMVLPILMQIKRFS